MNTSRPDSSRPIYSHYAFEFVNPKDQSDRNRLESILEVNSDTIDGLRKDFQKEILEKTGLATEFLFRKGQVVGLISYCKNLKTITIANAPKQSFQIVTLLLGDPEICVGRGYRTTLLERLVKLAERNFSEGIHVWVKAEDVVAIEFYKKHSFKLFETEKNESNKTRYLLFRDLASQCSASSSAIEANPEPVNESRKRDRNTFNVLENACSDRDRDSITQDRSAAKKQELPTSTPISHQSAALPIAPVAYQAPHAFYQAPVSTTPSRYIPAAPRKPVSIPRPGASSLTSQGSNYSYSGGLSYEAQQSGQLRSQQSGVITHDITLRNEYINLIKSGAKTVEGRISSGMMLKFKQGERLKFYAGANQVVCEIVGIKRYQGFKEMLQGEGYKKCLPNVTSLDAAVAVYHNIPSYQQRASQSGVLAIEIKVVG